MASETEFKAPPSPSELLIRLDERSNITNESLRALKDEISSIKIDFRNAQTENRNEILKYVDSQVKPVVEEVCSLRKDVNDLKSITSGAKGVREFIGWINFAVLLLLAVLTFFK